MTIYTKVFSVTGQYPYYATVRTHALFVFRSLAGISLSNPLSRYLYITMAKGKQAAGGKGKGGGGGGEFFFATALRLSR